MDTQVSEKEHLIIDNVDCDSSHTNPTGEDSTEIEDFSLKNMSRPMMKGASVILLLMLVVSISTPHKQTESVLYAETDCGIEYSTSDKKCNDYSSPVLEGMDVVSYFDEADNTDFYMAPDDFSATLGQETISSTFDGYSFYFSSTENQALFDENPVKYIPTFGGFCAYGISGYDGMNYLHSESQFWSVPVDPDQYAILEGDLYLFRGSGAKELFVNKSQTNIKGGESQWTGWFGNCTGFFNTQCFMTS